MRLVNFIANTTSLTTKCVISVTILASGKLPY